MRKLSQQEQRIWEEAIRLHEDYVDKDLAHDAHGIWLLAGDAAKRLQLKYNCQLAHTTARMIVQYYLSLYRAAS